MRKAFVSGAAAFFAVSSFLFLPVGGQESGIQIAEAAGIRTADRELKKDKNYEPSDIYGRAHHIIYGGRKPHDDRVRVAVVINGDENIIVEDRVKNQIYSQLRAKFPRDNFAVMKGTDVNTRLLQYSEELYYDQRETAETQDNAYESKTSSMFGSITGSAGRSFGRFDHDYSGSRNIADNGSSYNEYDGNWNGSFPLYDANGNLITSYGSGDITGTNDGSYNRSIGINDIGNLVGNSHGLDVGGAATFGMGTQKQTADWSRVRKPSKVDVDGMPVGMQPRGLSDMQRMDYVRAGRECEYDYVFVLSFSNGKSKVYPHNFGLFNTHTIDKNVWLRIRLVDVNTGDYVYRNDIVAMGKTTNGHVNGRVIERSVQKAVKEALDDLALEY